MHCHGYASQLVRYFDITNTVICHHRFEIVIRSGHLWLLLIHKFTYRKE